MKQMRRLSIEFLRREISIAISGSNSVPSQEALNGVEPTTICPNCGSPWMTVVTLEGEDAAASAESIHRALQQHGLHLHISSAGEVSVCRRSFEQVKEKLEQLRGKL